MQIKLVNRMASLERKARRAIKNSPEARLLDKKSSALDRRRAAGRISQQLMQDLKSLLRLRRKRLVSRWLYVFLRGELPAAS
jgi:hypothetical protein